MMEAEDPGEGAGDELGGHTRLEQAVPSAYGVRAVPEFHPQHRQTHKQNQGTCSL